MLRPLACSPAAPPTPRGRARSIPARLLTGAAMLVALTLAGCAPAAVAGWEPPALDLDAGVRLLSANEAPVSPEPPVDRAALNLDSLGVGFVDGRIRNDVAAIAARFVHLPGVPQFNQRIDDLLWAAIDSTGVEYRPQAHALDSTMGDRGCLPGSTRWSARELLQATQTGLPDGSGTAITCEITGLSGTHIVIVLRTVTGSGETVSADTQHHWVVDVANGQVHDLHEMWRDDAASELWLRTVELLRREAGGISSAPLTPPDDAQLDLARHAHSTARLLPDGSLAVSLPAGITSPELESLGMEPTTQPQNVSVDAATAAAWGTPLYAQWSSELGLPFVGLPPAVGGVGDDCALVPCAALTHDDGPGALTPGLLDTLASRRAPVTFYVLGSAVGAHPDVVVRADAEGHEIGSHTMTHPDLTTIPLAEARAQVMDAAAMIRNLIDKPVTSFRPPYGEITPAITHAVGLPAVLWSIDTNDWRRPGPEALLARSVDAARPGDIILFHDVHPASVDVAGDVVDGLRDRGFTLVTVTTLFDGAIPSGLVTER